MIFSPACRAASTAARVGATASWMLTIGTPARSNIPPGEPNAFCMSMTSIAVRVGSRSTGSGRAWSRMRVLLSSGTDSSVAVALASAGARSGAVGVGFDDAHEHVDEELAFRGIEHVEDLLLQRKRGRVKPVEQPLALRCEADEPCPSIGVADSPCDETFGFEAPHEQARAVAVDSEARGERALVQ